MIITNIALHNDYFRLKSYLSLDRKTIIKKLGLKDAKMQKLGVQGRWNKLIRGLTNKNMKAVKKRQLRIFGKWS